MTDSDQQGTVRDVFGSSAAAYDARQYGARYRTYIADRQKLVAKVLRELAIPTAARVLDVACGPGHFLVEAAALGTTPVGIDSSGDMLRTAGARLGPRAMLVRGDAMALPFRSGAFDAVNCSGLIEYLPEPLPLLREILRVLRPGGTALVASTNRLSPALVLEPVVDAARGSRAVASAIRMLRLPFEESTLQRRRFRLTFHSPRALAALMDGAGFERTALRYHHLQLLPHPLDRLVPSVATACVALTDWLLRVPPARIFSEGIVAVARRPS